jgi:hypothetical protein
MSFDPPAKACACGEFESDVRFRVLLAKVAQVALRESSSEETGAQRRLGGLEHVPVQGSGELDY